MSSIAFRILPSLFSDYDQTWIEDDVLKRTIVPLNTRRRHHRRSRILRKFAHLRLSLPSVTPPPPPPPEYMFSGDVDSMDVDMERNPYYHWISRDGSGRWRRKTTAALTSTRVLAAMVAALLVFMVLVMSMIPQSTILSLVNRVRVL